MHTVGGSDDTCSARLALSSAALSLSVLALVLCSVMLALMLFNLRRYSVTLANYNSSTMVKVRPQFQYRSLPDRIKHRGWSADPLWSVDSVRGAGGTEHEQTNSGEERGWVTDHSGGMIYPFLPWFGWFRIGSAWFGWGHRRLGEGHALV